MSLLIANLRDLLFEHLLMVIYWGLGFFLKKEVSKSQHLDLFIHFFNKIHPTKQKLGSQNISYIYIT